MVARGFVVSTAKMWYMTYELESSAEDRVENNAADKLIMRHIGKKSPTEIAELTGMDRDWVLKRKNELLEEIDVLTVEQMSQKIVIELQQTAEMAMERARTALDEFKSGLFNSAIAANKEVLKQIQAIRNSSNVAVESLNRLRKMELLRLMEKVVDAGSVEVAERYGLDQTEVLGIFRAKLVEQAQAIEDTL